MWRLAFVIPFMTYCFMNWLWWNICGRKFYRTIIKYVVLTWYRLPFILLAFTMTWPLKWHFSIGELIYNEQQSYLLFHFSHIAGRLVCSGGAIKSGARLNLYCPMPILYFHSSSAACDYKINQGFFLLQYEGTLRFSEDGKVRLWVNGEYFYNIDALVPKTTFWFKLHPLPTANLKLDLSILQSFGRDKFSKSLSSEW